MLLINKEGFGNTLMSKRYTLSSRMDMCPLIRTPTTKTRREGNALRGRAEEIVGGIDVECNWGLEGCKERERLSNFLSRDRAQRNAWSRMVLSNKAISFLKNGNNPTTTKTRREGSTLRGIVEEIVGGVDVGCNWGPQGCKEWERLSNFLSRDRTRRNAWPRI